MFRKINKFIQDVKTEMAKVSWPSRQELKGTTVIVIVLTLIFAVFIFIVDKALQGLLNIVY
ncbi:preprotein translocase subunit SecE [candidate division KSB1 bacterium]|nr:preprotein translocase subunit SecE [candidate division KSB1 bacterium]MBL7094713.1 preprotein translocase subunit SecE [candidate division KSB1 bacterium]